MLKHSGNATRLGADSPDERGGRERTLVSGRLGSGPEVEVFAAKNFTLGPDPGLHFGARPGGFALGPDPVRGYLVMARMKVAMDMSIEVMVKKMLVEELKKALRA